MMSGLSSSETSTTDTMRNFFSMPPAKAVFCSLNQTRILNILWSCSWSCLYITHQLQVGHIFVIANKTAFCLGERQGMLLNDECSFWYNRVYHFQYQFGIGENSYCTPTNQHAWPDRTLLLQSVWSKALSATTVEGEQLFIYSSHQIMARI